LAVQREDIPGADRVITCLRKHYPEALAEPEVQMMLALVANLKQDQSEVATIATRIPERHDYHLLAHVARLDALLEEDRTDEAVQECDWLIENTRDRAETPGEYTEADFVETKCRLLMNRQRYEEALETQSAPRSPAQ
jgi:hypothetical protein